MTHAYFFRWKDERVGIPNDSCFPTLIAAFAKFGSVRMIRVARPRIAELGDPGFVGRFFDTPGEDVTCTRLRSTVDDVERPIDIGGIAPGHGTPHNAFVTDLSQYFLQSAAQDSILGFSIRPSRNIDARRKNQIRRTSARRWARVQGYIVNFAQFKKRLPHED